MQKANAKQFHWKTVNWNQLIAIYELLLIQNYADNFFITLSLFETFKIDSLMLFWYVQVYINLIRLFR